MFGRNIAGVVPIVNREPSQRVTSLVRGVGCIAIRDPVVRFSTDCELESETDIAVADYNALLYGFPDVQLVVEMTSHHIHLLNTQYTRP